MAELGAGEEKRQHNESQKGLSSDLFGNKVDRRAQEQAKAEFNLKQ